MNRELSISNRLTNPNPVYQLIGLIKECFRAWRQNHRTRQQLSGLDNYQLLDLGLADIDRQAECKKWFWQL